MNDSEINRTAELLSLLQPGFLPLPIFEEIARLVALPILEVVPLRVSAEGNIEVLLLKRDLDDKKWPGMYHTPGTVIRATDTINNNSEHWAPFKRIFDDELKRTNVSEPHYVGSLLHKSKRGVEQSQLYWVEVLDKTMTGKFYHIKNLPPNLIESQEKFIKAAVKSYRRVIKLRQQVNS